MRVRRFAGLLGVLWTCAEARAEWVETASNQLYNDVSNWSGAIIDDTFTGSYAWGANPYNVILDGERSTGSSVEITYANPNFFLLTGINGASLELNGDLLVNLTGLDFGQVAFGSDTGTGSVGIDLNGGSRQFTITPGIHNNTDTLVIRGAISNGSLVKSGAGTIIFEGALTLSALSVLQGAAEFATSSSIAATSISLGYGAILRTRDAAAISDSTSLVLNGGRVQMEADGIETMASLTLERGQNQILFRNGGVAAREIHLSSLAIGTEATLLIGQSPNSPSQLGDAYKVFTSAGAPTGIGGSGLPGTTTISILPWAAFTNSSEDLVPSSSDRAVGGFLRYDPTRGFVPLNKTTEYLIDSPGSWNDPDVNVRITSAQALSADAQINSLFFNGGNFLDLNGHTLSIQSGGIIAGDPSNTRIEDGTLDFGAATVFLHSYFDLDVRAEIITQGSLVAASGNVNLARENQIGGKVVVQGGLILNHADAVSVTNPIILEGSRGVFSNDQVSGWLRVGDVIASAGSLSGVGLVQFEGTSGHLSLGGSSDATLQRVSVGELGFIAPGDPDGDLQAGSLVFGQNVTSLAFETASLLRIDLGSPIVFDTIHFTAGAPTVNFASGSTMEISFLGNYAPQVGDSWQVLSVVDGSGLPVSGINVTGTGSVSLEGPAGYVFSLDSAGVLSVVAVPEPATGLLLALGVAALTGRHVLRRRQWRR